ncbi:MAG: small multi-drug export protein [Candidatus Bipolaricaulota bacterium]|nr:small multi-drug export protein [Candidatus Bipolaricaulota bacterium]MCS7273933.1 small multi-drug export protein [Candidatus Bipolaricaulota bacterium]MDW8111073.1 small multi-drug export protein [Candidatus Bipolaricaulota bacterium]MDW8329892.1 small multi-drug export protein [Candidatus Bipolaricaulota bacterium]
MLEQFFVVLIVAALPISELRGAIPVAIGVYGFDPVTAYLLGVFGNLLPVPILLKLLEPFTALLRRAAIGDRLVGWLWARTRRRHSAMVERLGAIALVLLVAVPLPATGAWTGALVAHVFGIPFKYAFPLIAVGVSIAGILVTLATLGVIALL